jgi:hypothetical protein
VDAKQMVADVIFPLPSAAAVKMSASASPRRRMVCADADLRDRKNLTFVGPTIW